MDTFMSKYEFDVDRHKFRNETHTVICANAAMGVNGEGSVRFWIEKRHPEKTIWPDNPDEKVVHVAPFTEEVMGRTIYSYEGTVHNPESGWSEDDRDWMLRSMILAVAGGATGASAASKLLYEILAFTAIRDRDEWLREGAPEWFALIDPEREKV